MSPSPTRANTVSPVRGFQHRRFRRRRRSAGGRFGRSERPRCPALAPRPAGSGRCRCGAPRPAADPCRARRSARAASIGPTLCTQPWCRGSGIGVPLRQHDQRRALAVGQRGEVVGDVCRVGRERPAGPSCGSRLAGPSRLISPARRPPCSKRTSPAKPTAERDRRWRRRRRPRAGPARRPQSTKRPRRRRRRPAPAAARSAAGTARLARARDPGCGHAAGAREARSSRRRGGKMRSRPRTAARPPKKLRARPPGRCRRTSGARARAGRGGRRCRGWSAPGGPGRGQRPSMSSMLRKRSRCAASP